MVVIETYTLYEIELSKYCKENGYYVENIKRWPLACIGANDASKYADISNNDLKAELS